MERRRAIELGALVLLAVGLPIAYLGGSGDDVTALVIVGVIALLLTVALFERGVPHYEAESGAPKLARNALIFAVASLVLLVVFWTGLSIIIGAVAVELGIAARNRRVAADSGKAIAAISIGAFAAILAFVAMLVG
ncbi:MAG: hypothetical protein QOE08_2253 [Thermoleophilaceae bacterium]|jgi:hypothetical protein|nr:hypothetical protein [Thermoleophilaceae bacterium]